MLRVSAWLRTGAAGPAEEGGAARYPVGRVCTSSAFSQIIALCRSSPHMVVEGCSEAQTAGRLGSLKIRQRFWTSSWMQRAPAGLPAGMPGIGLEIDGAMQHAPQPGRQASSVGLWRGLFTADCFT